MVNNWLAEHQENTGISLEVYREGQEVQISQISEVKVYMANISPKAIEEDVWELCRNIDEPLEVEFPLNSAGKNKGTVLIAKIVKN